LTSGFFKSRLTFIVVSYLIRCKRLFCHLIFQKSVYKIPSDRWYDWPVDLGFYIFDVLLIPDLADMLMNGYKRMRQLSNEELEMVHELFAANIRTNQVYIWEKAKPLKKGLYHAFVSFNTIQSIKPLSLPILIHEMVHVWQYQRFGSVYIYRALKAQQSNAGYNYGGFKKLLATRELNKDLVSFNFEQQAEIMEDYIRLKRNKEATDPEMQVYKSFVDQLNYSDKIG